MLTQQSMVYFAPGPWHGLWRNRHQLMSLFARHGNKVLFVEGRSHLRPALAAWRSGKIGAAEIRQPLLQKITENLYSFHYPVWAPISGRMPVSWMTQKARSLALRTALRRLQMEQPIVWFSQPSMGDLLDEVPAARLRLYHVVDEYSAYTGQSAEHSQREQRLEKELIQQVDAVIVVSPKLYEAKSPYHDSTYLVPNGVDYDAYTQALRDSQLPADLAAVPEPRIGYSGLVGDKLNLSMLHELAVAKPHCSLVFLGEARFSTQAEAWRALVQLPNVHYLGEKPVAEVPHYLKGFQVGLMPYLQNRHAEHISPLKLYDYLAAGLAVASIDLPAVDEFRQQVHVAVCPGDFIHAVEAALADAAPGQRAARRAIAAQHTWEARAQQLSEVIQQQLASANGAD
ncbi:MAG: glycosyltransferase [Caldilineaceae bacterium]|nr:glycosyltransferase [Caldilineaceae bacterium]